MEPKEIKIKPFKISAILAGIAVFIAILSTAIWYFPTRFQWDTGDLFNLFFIDREKNFPTMFQVTVLLFDTVLLFTIAYLRKKEVKSYFPHWMGLAFGFLFMSCDEFISLHEMLVKPFNHILGRHRSDMFYFSWVLPGIIVVVVLAIIYIKFLLNLPRKTMLVCLLAGLLYVGGAVGMEMVGGWVVETFGEMTKQYIIAATIEECLEMAGQILFVYGLLDYLAHQIGNIQLKFIPAKI
jgi:hypothetical protein